MINVAFVCLGNICRSPMAELIFKDLIKERKLDLSFRVSSFGTSDCEEGNSIYPPAKRTLIMHGIPGSHVAKQISLKDVKNNDYILVMDSSNLLDMLRLTGGNYGEKIFKLCSFTHRPRDVADPWYTRDFETAFSDIEDGCKCFLEYILKEKAEALDYDRRH
ncbi:MAG: low molecular weight phosphotyrosine protein phosphatase [Clostridia bacterium]|nr:low molecular weight phosphotyrosine protein phosphatase [Clostridia bacterium]